MGKKQSNKIDASLLTLDVSKIIIKIPAEEDSLSMKYEDRIIAKHIPFIRILYPPMLVSKGKNEFELAWRRWSYRLQIKHDITQIHFLVFKEQVHLDFFLEKIAPKDHAAAESVIKALVKQTSSATRSRHKAINACRLCPFCADALMDKRTKQIPDDKGFYRIHCYNSKQNRCDFYALISTPEYRDFEKYTLRSKDWIRPIAEKFCPKCGSQIYLRILHLENNVKQYFEVCRNSKFSTKLSCDYSRKLAGEPK